MRVPRGRGAGLRSALILSTVAAVLAAPVGVSGQDQIRNECQSPPRDATVGTPFAVGACHTNDKRANKARLKVTDGARRVDVEKLGKGLWLVTPLRTGEIRLNVLYDPKAPRNTNYRVTITTPPPSLDEAIATAALHGPADIDAYLAMSQAERVERNIPGALSLPGKDPASGLLPGEIEQLAQTVVIAELLLSGDMTVLYNPAWDLDGDADNDEDDLRLAMERSGGAFDISDLWELRELYAAEITMRNEQRATPLGAADVLGGGTEPAAQAPPPAGEAALGIGPPEEELIRAAAVSTIIGVGHLLSGAYEFGRGPLVDTAPGDVDRDGDIDDIDYTLAWMLVRSGVEDPALDFDQDGDYDRADVFGLIRHVEEAAESSEEDSDAGRSSG